MVRLTVHILPEFDPEAWECVLVSTKQLIVPSAAFLEVLGEAGAKWCGFLVIKESGWVVSLDLVWSPHHWEPLGLLVHCWWGVEMLCVSCVGQPLDGPVHSLCWIRVWVERAVGQAGL